MSKQEVLQRIGPWPGGLNTAERPENIADNELAFAENVIIDDEGFLFNRPPINSAMGDILAKTGLTLATLSSAILETRPNNLSTKFFLFAGAGVATNIIYTTDVRPGDAALTFNTWTAAYASAAPGKSINGPYEYNGLYWWVPFSSASGFSSATNLTGGFTAIPNMPLGIAGKVYKDRLFIWSTTRLSWSKATDLTVWAAPDGGFVNIAIKKIFLINNTFYIINAEGVWTFNYSDDPALDGVLQKVYDGTVIDAVTYQNRLFIWTGSDVWEFVNGQMYLLSEKINLRQGLDTSSSTRFYYNSQIFVVGGYLYLVWGGFSTNAEGYGYLMNLRTGKWTSMDVTGDVIPSYVGRPDITGMIGFFTGGFINSNLLLYWDFSATVGTKIAANPPTVTPQVGMSDTVSSGVQGTYTTFNVTVRTKRYDFGDMGRWKRFKFLRSMHEILDYAGGGTNTFKWSVLIDNFYTNPIGGSTIAGQNLSNKAHMVDFDGAANVRFRTIQFQFDSTVTVASPAATQRSQIFIEGLVFAFSPQSSRHLV